MLKLINSPILKTLQAKIIVSFIILLVIPINTAFFVMNKQLEQSLENKISDSMQNTLTLTASTIENTVLEMLSSVTRISTDKSVIDILKSSEEYTEYERLRVTDNLILFNSNFYHGKAPQVTILDFQGNIYSTWMRDRNEYNRLIHYEWYNDILSSNGNFVWIYGKSFIDRDERFLISLARIIDGFRYGEKYGVVLVSCYEDELYKILKKVSLEKGGRIQIVNNNGLVICDTLRENMGTSLASKSIYKDIINQEQGYLYDESNGEKEIVNFSTISNTGWKIIQYVPSKRMFGEIEGIRYKNFIVISELLLLFVVITIIISFKITKPIKVLRKEMSKIRDENMYEIPYEYGNDEISGLILSYNKMIKRIKELLSKILQEQKQKDYLKFKALQAQINPHFVLNTLNNIKFMAYMSQANEVAKMISCLGGILEESAGKGKDFITLTEELKYIDNYVYLQKIRYDEKVSVSYSIAEDVKNCMIFKLLLQPIIENCYKHGLSEGEAKVAVSVTAERTKGDICILVKDDGIGIEPCRLKIIQNELESAIKEENSEHIGLKNINERIKINYGARYGLSIHSTYREGAEVRIYLPYIIEPGQERM